MACLLVVGLLVCSSILSIVALIFVGGQVGADPLERSAESI